MAGALVAEGVRYRYRRRGPDVLAGLDWTIAPGSRTVLIGPAGSGKSTLLGLLARVSVPRRGRVHLDDGGDLRRLVGRLPQSPAAIPGLSVEEHVAYGCWLNGHPRADATSRAAEWLGLVGLGDQATHLAAALKPVQLPRLALAEALASGARFVVLDAPVDDVAPHERDTFWNVVGQVPRSLAVVVSSRASNTATRAVDAVAVLVDGALRFTGSRAEFLARGGGPTVTPKRAAGAAYRSLLGDGGVH